MDASTMSDLPEDEKEKFDAEGPSIAASAEMEEALREATEAMEARRADPVPVGSDGTDVNSPQISEDTPDKLTIELLSKELQDLKALYEQTVQECEEAEERYLRLHAEFDNFRRRGLKEKQESLQFGHQNLVKDLLSAVDNLERALEHGAQNTGPEAKGILDGVELVHREVLGALAKHGVTQIEAEGKTFDPAVHEAMGQVPNDEVPANTVLQVLQKGYQIRDRMLRPARVLVSRESSAAEAAGSGEPGTS
jgi:molecular chaperone GrpE